MNLILDFGNTRVKAATYNQGSMVEQVAYTYEYSNQLFEWINNRMPYSAVIVSSVKDLTTTTTHQILQLLPAKPLIFSNNTPIPIVNSYLTPETLGNDRLAAAVAAHHSYPNSNVLVIDVGTAITYDLTTLQGEFLGGNISPGVSLRLKALHRFTDKLPLVEANFSPPIMGKNTTEAIQCGVFQGILAEIEGIISKLTTDLGSLAVILTGGDAIYFVEKLKNPIFVNLNLVFDGLNLILEFNASNKNI